MKNYTKELLNNLTVGKRLQDEKGYELLDDNKIVGKICAVSLQVYGYGEETLCGWNYETVKSPRLLADVRKANDLFHAQEEEKEKEKEKLAEKLTEENGKIMEEQIKNGLCPRCHTYCYGDCQAQ